MKRYFFRISLFVCFVLLAGCAYNEFAVSAPYSPCETWLTEIESQTGLWTCGTDDWFKRGNPNAAGMPPGFYSAPIVSLHPKTANFSRLKIKGDFQVRIAGTLGKDCVNFTGPKDAVKAILIHQSGKTLYLQQIKKAPHDMPQAIVYIYVNCLDSLVQAGRGKIEGIQIKSPCLDIISNGSGNIYLSGNMNLRRLINVGQGCVTIFGADTPVLDIQTNGTGVTNVCGNIGIRSIMHHGRTNINIVGANSDCLRILADGSGKIGVDGPVNLYEVRVTGSVRVYANKVLSGGLNICAKENARVGIAGSANNVSFETKDAAWIYARQLSAQSVFARSYNRSHINVSANGKIFAASSGSSSIYYFGQPMLLTSFLEGSGTVITMRR